jgi:hypothetical protein
MNALLLGTAPLVVLPVCAPTKRATTMLKFVLLGLVLFGLGGCYWPCCHGGYYHPVYHPYVYHPIYRY